MTEIELWSAVQTADYLELASAGAARRALSRWGVQAARYEPGATGRPEARYDAGQVRRAAERRPGRGARTDLSSSLSKLPIWTEVGNRADEIYESVDSRGVVWRLWCVWDDTSGRPPLEWRFAPVDALDQVSVIEHIGGGKELDIASMRIDAHEVVRDQRFRDGMGLDEPTD